ncbi:MAG: YgiQ family radical SAM protein [Flexilinea sp.]|nr:YgiQ family radical SAM protein [Flexilinea sp.]HOG59765.1 YgiQ family radical SAM protein [Flexilinea sp.]HOR56562.1 YgiQ family radical SAM protein [Flexilinea sp.]
MFLPTTKEELNALGWEKADVILINGDSYIDSPYSGIALLGRILEKAGYKVGIIAQPDTSNLNDISRLGEPALFWGVSAGAVDSMVSNYTALKKPRSRDDFTPGGINNRRPDRASIVYTNLIRRAFKNTKPILLGGIEASLRRISHYDYWTDKIRGSILLDAKADYLLYGMADKSILQFAEALKNGQSPQNIRGLVFASHELPENALVIPSLEEVRSDQKQFIKAFRIFYENCDPITAHRIAQKHDERYIIQNPPAKTLSQQELDEIYSLPFTREQHPYYEAQGPVKALETTRFSVVTHRGCYGECNFCAIAVHEGRTVQWRSEKSILAEIETISKLPDFKGIITDLSGPTANMYGFECSKKLAQGACKDKRCLYPKPCLMLKIDHQPSLSLLDKARKIPGIKKVFVASGIRYDMILHDSGCGKSYTQELCNYHVSGQLKVAPEHDSPKVLQLMGKPGKELLLQFKRDFDQINRDTGKKQYLSYYFIAAHPGCTIKDMQGLKTFANEELHIAPEQTQIFTPTPSTWSTLMYATETNPFTGEHIFVEKDPNQKQRQKDILTQKEQKKTWTKHS